MRYLFDASSLIEALKQKELRLKKPKYAVIPVILS